MSRPPTISLPPLNTSHQPVISPSPAPLPAEVFVFVRPPPGKNINPLNLQVQLILPTLPNPSTAPPPTRSASISSHHLGRSPSVRSGHSSRSNRSLASLSSSEAYRGRRVLPLYNLEWHTVLPTWILDAGTDAKIAKFVKRAIEIHDFASIEPAEIRSGPSFLNQLTPISSNRPLSPILNASSSPSAILTSETESKTLAPTWFQKIKKINFRKSLLPPLPSAPIEPLPDPEPPSCFAPSDGPMISTGPSPPSANRPEGYIWMVRRWIRPDPPQAMVLVEWRKAPKHRPAGPAANPNPSSSSPRRSLILTPPLALSSSPHTPRKHRHSAIVTGPTDVADPNLFNTSLTVSRSSSDPCCNPQEHQQQQQPEEDSGQDSEPEDSERPWDCELVIHPPAHHHAHQSHPTVGSTSLIAGGNRFHMGTFTPQPHHPRLVGKLAVPWNLAPVFPDHLDLVHPQEDHIDQPARAPTASGPMLSVEDLKDLVVITSMWLIVKEELGGLTSRKKPTTSGSLKTHNIGLVGVKPPLSDNNILATSSTTTTTTTTVGSSTTKPSSPGILPSVSTGLDRVISPISGGGSTISSTNNSTTNHPHHGLLTSPPVANLGRLWGWSKLSKTLAKEEATTTTTTTT